MMSRHDLHAEREWRKQMEEKEQFYAWDNPPKKTKVPRDDDYERTLLLMVVILALLPIAVGGIVWAIL